MRLFRSTWLQRIMTFLLLVLLSICPFDYIEQSWAEENEFIICSPHCLAKLSSTRQKPPLKCNFDVVPVSVLPNFTKFISADYILGMFFNLTFTNFITNVDRGPPRIAVIL